MATKPIELTSDASGRTYTWDRPEPPTDADIAELMAADRAFLEERAQGQQKLLEAAKTGAMFSGLVSSNPVEFRESMKAIATEVAPSLVEGGITTAAQGAGGILAGPPGAVAGGAVGGAVGNVIAQTMRGGEGISGPEIAGAAASGTVPGSGLTKMGVRGFAKEAGKQAAANVGGLALQRLMEGKPLDEKEAATFAGMSALSTALGKLVDPGKIATAAERKAIHNYHNDLAMKALQAKGMKILPSMRNPARLNQALEVLAGKEATIADIRQLNEELFTGIAAAQVGIQPQRGVKLSTQLNEAKKDASKFFGDIQELAAKHAGDLEALKKTELTAANAHELAVIRSDPDYVKKTAELTTKANADADKFLRAKDELKLARKQYERTGIREDLDKVKEWETKSNQYGKDLEDGLLAMDRKDLHEQFLQARRKIGMINEIEDALTPGEFVDPQKLASAMQRGVPFTGDLENLARFASDPRFKSLTTLQVKQPSESSGRLGQFLDIATEPGRALLKSDLYQKMVAASDPGAMPDFIARFARTSAQAEMEKQEAQKNRVLEFYKNVYPRQQPPQQPPQAPRPVPFR